MATQPSGGGVVAGSSAAPPKKSSFWSCFSCRMVAGSGLLAAGLWVHLGAHQSLRGSRPGNLYDIFRIVFAIGLYSGAIVVILDPVQPK
ncbi:distal membrane-arm assembly complex protein 1 [Pituophis catenifer annectens]|uniref:distal membrane-arm assembly complex protein 1 n=1 Tax=Pituophis catenifer annectens TaxID=94852 RepID=UPI00399605E6